MAIKWAKVLYEKNGLPDNHTDSNFLKELKKNLHFKPPTAQSAVLASTRISTRINVTVIFWIVFLQISDENPSWVINYLFFSFFMLLAYGLTERITNLSNVLRNLVQFLALGYACTPILKSLTVDISTDSIYAMASTLMLVHLIFHQYEPEECSISSPYLSLNAAVCGAICLASRLSDTTEAFILLTLAAQAFALFPELNEHLNFPLSGFFLSTLSAVVGMCYISLTAASLLVLLLISVNIVFPLLFVWSHKYKDNIYGPWDEAKISNQNYDIFVK